ncbi:MAG TPA: Rne/Rng family ribonuclease [Pyrinomonadaceae bacterium]|jgi:ribonuclease G|nr:Rne/Rng family ribonuclease [Pyrinomonadaceae bacterium]
MAKELIVSVNGREKKIAIIEDEQVTEFYIERGEENQGIVGNIYKGRVMRVLPGMQSAFVDIGLERDAFLYVSDFFDEEEEFERIVLDKTKKTDAGAAERAAREQLEQARVEREQHIEATQERFEPLNTTETAATPLDTEEETATAVLAQSSSSAAEVEPDEALPRGAPTTAAAAAEAPTAAQGEETEEGGHRRGRRSRRRGKGSKEQVTEAGAAEGAPRFTPAIDTSDIGTPFAAPVNDFQRVVDEEEVAAENGAMFKDARLQERIFDQIHAVEFDIEGIHETEVGSLLNTGLQSDASFQRIDDSDIAPSDEGREGRAVPVQQAVAAHVSEFIDEVSEDASGSQSFERVSDDEKFAEGVGVEEVSTAAETARGGRASKATQRGARKGRGATKSAAVEAAEGSGGAADEDAAKPKRTRSTTKKAATKSTTKRAAASKKAATTGRGGRKRRTGDEGSEGQLDIDVLETEAERAEHTDVVASEAADEAHFEAGTTGDEEAYEDGEAGVSTGGRSRAEFATRRGGRRRRRPGKSSEDSNEEGRSNGKDDEAETPVEAEESVAPPAPATPPPSRSQGRRDGRSERGGGGGGGGRDDRRSGGRSGGGSGREGGGGRDGGGGGGGGSRRDRQQQPTITDLLREGQEIMVQIAKEPIAKKGARITSHIALPGRFLVYMPTVEHVGVSRKIESDSERVRLRKLIQAIRAEEDVPSGGFIVRTAGIGISEEDLRDDARYLVRTWLEIRKGAEKAKAPAMVHKDLDLVQRILRDQLSEEFTAIRVDSEEEYREIVEFVNRIQPRMVKRVKLYTRDEPILEAFGVQAEIDKAIKPRVWLRSGGYLVINQTEALVAIDVNTGKFVGRGGTRLEDTITRTNMEAVEEIVRQIRLRDLGGIIVLDLIDMEDRRNRNRVMQALQEALQGDKSPTKVLSFNDFGLVIMTRKRVKQSLERTLCAPCPYCQGAGLVKSAQTICYEILEEARRLSRGMNGDGIKQTTLRINPEVARALHGPERDVLVEIEDYLGAVDITSDPHVHQEQFDFAFI